MLKLLSSSLLPGVSIFLYLGNNYREVQAMFEIPVIISSPDFKFNRRKICNNVQGLLVKSCLLSIDDPTAREYFRT
jgi:hypothetical protein